MYHQEGSDTMYVGGRAVVYVLTFTSRGVRDLQVWISLTPSCLSGVEERRWFKMLKTSRDAAAKGFYVTPINPRQRLHPWLLQAHLC